MNQDIRNKLRNVVTHCRKLLEDSVSQELEGKYGIFAKKDQVTADPNAKMSHLTEEEQVARKDILDHFGHIKARGFKPKEALDQLVREIAFTHLNRLCAYKMMEAREVYVGEHKFREAVSRGIKSNGFLHYLGMDGHEADERLYSMGQQDIAYRHFLDWLGGLLSEEIGVLFNPNDPANRLYPRQKTLDEVLKLLNEGGIKPEETDLREEWPKIWSQDETLGWVYQYFTPKELRDQARKESAAPRNSYELAFRNQFFTPRYVVEFLVDNTLGRIWFEMRKGDTKLKDECQYMVRRPTEHFLKDGEQSPKDATEGDDLSQEELLKLPVYIRHRPKKDPRELRILDPASGSGHFLLYCFDLLLTIYEEAYSDTELGPALQTDYPKLEDLRRDVPRLILSQNVHGIDIDLRASQIAALALWLRCQRAYQEIGLKKERPKITRSNFVCAEPMPGEEQMRKDFVWQLEPKFLGQVVEAVFDKMKLAGEAGALLKIEEDIREAVAAAKKQWMRETVLATDRKGQPLLFTQATMDRLAGKIEQASLFDLSDITDKQFFEQAETRVIEALRQYAEKAQNGHQLQRRLFADDAVRGFAFVDLCQKQYDAVLMNPPFGAPSKPSQEYLKSSFPSSKNDLFATFVERGLLLLSAGSRLGAITSRTGCFLTSFSKWREEIVLRYSQPHAFADLGSGVLDTAVVETAAYSLQKTPHSTASPPLASPFFRLLKEEDKESVLKDAINSLHKSPPLLSSCTYLATPDSFRHVPGSPFSYWASDAIRSLFRSLPTFDDERHGRSTRCGLGTLDDFRFIRLRWEINSQEIGTKWRVYYHGGVYSPFHDEFPCVVLWANDGAAIKSYVEAKVGSASRKVQGEGDYFKQGFVFPRRTKGFAPKFMPQGGIFSTAGQAGFVPPNDLAWTIALLSSRICTFLLSLSQGRTGDAAQFEVGLVKRLPWPRPDASTRTELSSLSQSAFQITVALCSYRETSHFFVIPPAARYEGATLSERFRNWTKETGDLRSSLLSGRDRINQIALRLYGVSEDDIGTSASSDDSESNDDDDLGSINVTEPSLADEAVEGQPLDETDFVRSMVSYLVGCVLGVWDVRHVFDKSDGGSPLIPTDPLPRLSPGQFQSGASFDVRDGVRQVVAEGILVDDQEHSDDIVRRVRDVIEVVFGEQSEEIENEMLHVLDVGKLRDYFRKAANGGFWNDHVSRYSNSRRNAPVYWLLQSSKKSYAVWLYYHRLDKDLLFKVLVNYVEPKIRMETSRLEALRSQRAAAGDSGKEAKRLAEEVEQQEDFISELGDFEDKLRRAANLHLVPDLNDGVVLNIAPLWELVPWKEAKNYWEELLKGEYEWSSIGKQLRQKGLVK